MPAGKLDFDNRIPNRGRTRVFVKSGRTTLPRCVMFGDSFGGNLLPFLKESFSTLVYVYGKTFDRELIEAYRPDVVLSEFVERFLIDPPVDTPTFSYASVVRTQVEASVEGRSGACEMLKPDRSILTYFPVRPVYRCGYCRRIEGKSIRPALIADLKKHHPNDPEAHRMISVELARLGERLDEARTLCRTRSQRQNRGMPVHATSSALTLMRLELPDKAEVELRKAIELDVGVD